MEGGAAEDAELQAALAMSMEQEQAPAAKEEAPAAAAAPAAAKEEAPAAAEVEAEPLTFRVTHRKDVLRLSMPPTATVTELHLKLEELTGIQPSMQKVMFKGGLKDKTKTLQEVGIKNGVKMMLVGSKQDDVAKLKKAEAAVAKEPTPEAAAAAEKTPVCEEKEHKRVLDKGKPADAEAGVACPPGAHAALPENLKGLLNGSGAKVRGDAAHSLSRACILVGTAANTCLCACMCARRCGWCSRPAVVSAPSRRQSARRSFLSVRSRR